MVLDFIQRQKKKGGKKFFVFFLQKLNPVFIIIIFIPK